MESFIEHQDACTFGRLQTESQSLQPANCLSGTASSPSPSSDTNLTTVPWPRFLISTPSPKKTFNSMATNTNAIKKHNLELQLLTTTTSSFSPFDVSISSKSNDDHSTHLQLSIGSSDFSEKTDSENDTHKSRNDPNSDASRLKDETREQLRQAMAEKAYAEEARKQAKRQIDLAEQEFANAKRIRRQAQGELEKAQALKEQAIRQINSTISQITCHVCKEKFQAKRIVTTSIVPSL